MLKLLTSRRKKLNNFLCGEVYCITPTIYNVACRICSKTVPFEKFPLHFKDHWDQVEKDCKNDKDQVISKASLAVETSNKVIKFEEEEIYYEDEFGQKQQQQFPCEELDEKPIDLEDLQEIKLSEVQSGMTLEEENSVGIQKIRLAEASDIEFSEDEGLQTEELVETSDEFVKENKEEFNDSEHDPDWQDEQTDEDTIPVQGNAQPNKIKREKETQPVSCSHCPRWFKSTRGLKRHLLSNNVSIPYKRAIMEHKCKECGEIFRSERLLLGHRWKHTGLKCDICGRTFTQAGNLKSHKIRHSGVKSQKCDQCNSSFFTKAELKLHKQRHESLRYICELCGRPCLNGSVLRSHMRRHTGERPAKCEVCGKRFFSGFDLNVHSLSHTNERPFACDVCHATFKSKKSLRVHKLQHIPDRNYVCKICDKAFALEKGLASHMRTHNTPYIDLSQCKLGPG